MAIAVHMVLHLIFGTLLGPSVNLFFNRFAMLFPLQRSLRGTAIETAFPAKPHELRML